MGLINNWLLGITTVMQLLDDKIVRIKNYML